MENSLFVQDIDYSLSVNNSSKISRRDSISIVYHKSMLTDYREELYIITKSCLCLRQSSGDYKQCTVTIDEHTIPKIQNTKYRTPVSTVSSGLYIESFFW